MRAPKVRTDERMNLRMIASPLNEPDGAGSWPGHTSLRPQRQVNWKPIPFNHLDLSSFIRSGVSVAASPFGGGSQAGWTSTLVL